MPDNCVGVYVCGIYGEVRQQRYPLAGGIFTDAGDLLTETFPRGVLLRGNCNETLKKL